MALFTGAEGIKTFAQQAIYGGVAGEQYDPCYHLGCDDIDNLSLTALDQMSHAAAHATISLAQSTEAVNGRRSKGNFKVKAQDVPGACGDVRRPLTRPVPHWRPPRVRAGASRCGDAWPSPARITRTGGRGGSTSRANGTSRLTPSAQSVSMLGLPVGRLTVASMVLLAALVATSALLDGRTFAGAARPAGVLVGGVLAVRGAPFVVVVVAAAGTTAVLRLLGVA